MNKVDFGNDSQLERSVEVTNIIFSNNKFKDDSYRLKTSFVV
jgi:hypothetical protein